MTFAETSIKALKERDYKITGPRMAVLSVLEKAEVPLSAYDIEQKVPKSIPINIVTIYRVLDLLDELGIAHRIHTKEGFMRCTFKLSDGCHYFAVCNQCGKAYEFINKSCSIEKLIPENLPFKNMKHLSEIAGICDQCTLPSNS